MRSEKLEKIGSHTDTEIKGFYGEYEFLSNFYPCHVEYEKQVYQSSEAAYQAAKTLDLTKRIKFQAISANESKKMGRSLQLRPNWDNDKYKIMSDILIAKFEFNPGLKVKLLKTGDKYLEETNYWGDTYWGVCEGEGQNVLGKLLMRIREGYKNELNLNA